MLIYKQLLVSDSNCSILQNGSQISTKGKGPANQIKQLVTGQSNSSESHTNQTDNGAVFGAVTMKRLYSALICSGRL